MTPAGDAAPDRSSPDWIVRLHRHGCSADAHAPPFADSTVLLAGDVVGHRGSAGANFAAVSIHRRGATKPLELTPDVLDLRCEPRDLPESRNAAPTQDLGHVVHVLCSRFEDPESIERFMAATRGLVDGYAIGREAWLEVLPDPTGATGGAADEPIVDDIYLARYPSVEAWHGLDELERWRQAVDVLESEAATIFHLLVAPTVNRIAIYR